jgi:hypothetical protein
MILYTVTSDAVVRIFLPILDSPRRLQLHAAIDASSLVPSSSSGSYDSALVPYAGTAWLDRKVMTDSILAFQKDVSTHAHEEHIIQRLQEIIDESWDLFLRILQDGSVVLTAVTVSFVFPTHGLGR